MKVIFETEHLILFTDGINEDELYIHAKPKEIQEQHETMTTEDKLQRFDEFLHYFYNFWKIVEQGDRSVIYTMYFDVNLLMIEIPANRYIKIKKILESLKPILELNLKETYFKARNKLAEYFLKLVLTFYTPIKPIHIVS